MIYGEAQRAAPIPALEGQAKVSLEKSELPSEYSTEMTAVDGPTVAQARAQVEQLQWLYSCLLHVLYPLVVYIFIHLKLLLHFSARKIALLVL